MKHQPQLGLLKLIFIGISSTIGAGWIYGAWRASQLAGPAALIAWPIGALVMLSIALCYTELSGLFPKTGGMVRFAQLTHGDFAGFIAGWANWLSILSVIPVEAVTSANYLSTLPGSFPHTLVHNHALSPTGIIFALLLLCIYFLINLWSIKFLMQALRVVAILKLVIPITTAIVLLTQSFHMGNFVGHGGFAPDGISGIFYAVSTGGIIFAFHGFQSPINMVGEAKSPARNIPLAVIITIVIALIIYATLQFVYIGVLPTQWLANGFGAVNLSSPFAQLLIAVNIHWLLIVLYIDSITSPGGTALTYTATTAQMVTGLAKEGYVSGFLDKKHPKYDVSRRAMALNFSLCLILFYFFHSWVTLIGIISCLIMLGYLTGPVSACSLRRRATLRYPSVRIKGLPVIAYISFLLITFVMFWTKWPLTGEIILCVLASLPFYFYFNFKHGGESGQLSKNIKHGIWIPVHLILVALVSLIGDSHFGGLGLLGPIESSILLFAISTCMFIWGVSSSFRTNAMQELEVKYSTEPNK